MESDHLVDSENTESSTDYNTLFGGKEEAKFTQKTVFGEVRNWKRFSWLEWIFVAVASISILGVLGMTIERFVYFESHFRNISVKSDGSGHGSGQYFLEADDCDKWVCTNDFILTVVVILNLAFCALYVIDGLLREKMFELAGFAVAVTIIMIYIIANYIVKGPEGQALRLVRLILVVIGGPINILLASVISYKMGYFVFTTVGSNNTLIRAYKIRSFLLTLQYFLLQVMVNVLALSWSRDGDFISVAEKVILCLLLVHCFVVMPLGWATVMFEKNWLVPVWYFLLAPYYSYFVYKIVNVAIAFQKQYNTEVLIYEPDKTPANFTYIGVAIIVACVLGLLVLALLYVFMALSHHNFRKGLKDKVPPPTDMWLGLYHSSVARLGRKRQVSSRIP